MNIALIGNPNTGKSTLFNALTGASVKTGNWTGVTTQKSAKTCLFDKDVLITDLPGIYSMSAQSNDEKEVIEYLKNTPPDVIINVVDCNNLERNLYLTSLISELKIPFIVALNFSDEIKKNGLKIDVFKLKMAFGVDFIEISAKKRLNLDKLIVTAKKTETIGNDVCANKSVEQIYDFVAITAKNAISGKRSESFTKKADDILTGKFTGLPVFFAVIFLTYFFSLKIGGFFGGYIEKFFSEAGTNLNYYFTDSGFSPVLTGLFTDAIIKGVGSVLSFLPQVLVLFCILSLLEESGYMARVSFILDKFFKNFGLGGKSVFPFVLSCGCAVTGISATDTIKDEGEKEKTIILCPFMPCGAKTAVFGWFAYKFFYGSALIAASMYFLGFFSAAAVGIIIRGKKGESCFALEMPPLRVPSLNAVFKVVLEKTKEFLIKSGTVILAVSVVFWFLYSFGVHGYVGGEIEKSFLYYIGNLIKYLFYPLGFSDWKCSVAIISGLFAKEAVIETAEIIGVDFGAVLVHGYRIYAYMAFILLSPPCIAALFCANKHLKSKKSFINMIFIQTATAYCVSSAINLTGNILTVNRLIFYLIFIIIILSIATAFHANKKKQFPIKKNEKN